MNIAIKTILLDSLWNCANRIQDSWDMILKGNYKTALNLITRTRAELAQVSKEIEKETPRSKDVQRKAVAPF